MAGRLIQWMMRLTNFLANDGRADSAPQHLRTGRRGEDDAYLYLRKQGYIVVARNWRSPRQKGEVDLIAWEDDVLCFIEVKTRTSRDVKPAEAAVDAHKQRELRIMAREYLRRIERRRGTLRWPPGRAPQLASFVERQPGERLNAGYPFPAYRFDVVSVYYDSADGKFTDITLFRNAFHLS